MNTLWQLKEKEERRNFLELLQPKLNPKLKKQKSEYVADAVEVAALVADTSPA